MCAESVLFVGASSDLGLHRARRPGLEAHEQEEANQGFKLDADDMPSVMGGQVRKEEEEEEEEGRACETAEGEEAQEYGQGPAQHCEIGLIRARGVAHSDHDGDAAPEAPTSESSGRLSGQSPLPFTVSPFVENKASGSGDHESAEDKNMGFLLPLGLDVTGASHLGARAASPPLTFPSFPGH